MIEDVERQEEQNALTQPPVRSPNHATVYLDGLRGLAAFFVFIQHYIGRYDGNAHEHGFGEQGNYYLASLPFLRIVFSGGSAAVAIFFVLSGYVLSKGPLTLLRNGKLDACSMSLASAIIRRPFRLYIPTVGVALVFAILMHAPFGLVPELPWRPPAPSIMAEIWNWFVVSARFFNPFRTHGSNQAWYTYNIVAWTIPIELKGSMLVYVLTGIYAFSGFPQLVNLVSLVVTVVVLMLIGKWTMACFIAGLVLACFDVWSIDTTFFSRRLTRKSESLFRHAAFVAGYYLLCLPAHDGHPEFALDTPGYHYLTAMTPTAYDKMQYYRFWHSWGAVLFIYASLRIRWFQRFLNTRPLRYLGKVSFMLYLVHLPMLNILGDRVARMLGHIYDPAVTSRWDNVLYIPNIGPAAMSTRCFASLFLILPITSVVSEIGTNMFDTPSVRFGKRLVLKLGLDRGSMMKKEMEQEGIGLLHHSVHTPVPVQ